VSLGVVLSAALHGASARLTAPDAPVAAGQVVRFTAHPAPPSVEATAGAAPPARAAEADTAVAAPPVRRAPARIADAQPQRRASGGLQLEQLASSTGAASALTSYQSVGSLYLDAPLSRGIRLRTRASARWRGGAAARTTGLDGLVAIPYELQLRLGTPEAAVNASVGRFVPLEAVGLGYVDGARLELRLAPEQRVGVIAGFVPGVAELRFSTRVKRGGVYWAFGGAGPLAGSLSAAADWSEGARRRTLLASQAYWRLSARASLSFSTEVDVGTPAGTVHGTRLTNGYATLRTGLPFGFRGSVGVESHQAVTLWESVLAGDTLPPPGRLNGVSASLGHDLLGLRVDLSGGALKGQNDVSPTYRGTLSVGRGGFLLFATGQHGDLFDYGSAVVRWSLPYRALPFNASLGASVGMTRTIGGAVTQWRFGLQPELSWAVPGGLFVSLGGDVGTFAGRSSVFLHAGVSYHFR
jgi:hypothetical protein